LVVSTTASFVSTTDFFVSTVASIVSTVASIVSTVAFIVSTAFAVTEMSAIAGATVDVACQITADVAVRIELKQERSRGQPGRHARYV
jgi:hypothetical protein